MQPENIGLFLSKNYDLQLPKHLQIKLLLIINTSLFKGAVLKQNSIHGRVLYLDFLECNELSLQQVRSFIDLTKLTPANLLLNPEVCCAAEFTAWYVLLNKKTRYSNVYQSYCITELCCL